jgi:hypothetical protein
MTLTSTKTSKLTQEEWDELVALKNAINYSPASVHPDRQERFTYLFVKSLKSLSYVGNVDK